MSWTDQEIARFWSKVQVGTAKDCWPWVGPRGHSGYGLFSLQGKTQRAHRLVAELVGTKVIPGQIVMHTCDNPPCVNPAHLTVGTQADNMRDMASKGRHVWSAGRSKLRVDQVLEIRRRLSEGETNTVLAAEFHLHPSTVYHIKIRKYWPNL